MSIFNPKGFDTIIGKDVVITGVMVLNGTVVIDGHFSGQSIHSTQNIENKKRNVLHVNGTVDVQDVILSHDLTVTGTVTAKEVRVEGTLAVKAGAKVKADAIFYRTLMVEPGAVLLGPMMHLDHVSQGEQV